jgi:hypothetical protein
MHGLHRGNRVGLNGTVIRRERMTERPWMAGACPMQHYLMPSRTHTGLTGQTITNTIDGFNQVGTGSGFRQFAPQILDVRVHGPVANDTVVTVN